MICPILLWCLLVPGLALGAEPPVIEGARQEGALAVADTAPGANFQKFIAAFKAKYPFLDIATEFYLAPTGRVLARVDAEIDAKRLSFDVRLAANTAAWVEMRLSRGASRAGFPEVLAYHCGKVWNARCSAPNPIPEGVNTGRDHYGRREGDRDAAVTALRHSVSRRSCNVRSRQPVQRTRTRQRARRSQCVYEQSDERAAALLARASIQRNSCA
jgi:hypothetical protein